MSTIDPLIGQRLDNYLIQRKIGEGGMAVVYLAEDTALKRDVVIKMMLPHLAQQEELRLRFQREAQATAQLHHQNIVPVYTTGNAPNGQPYIAFQYVTGGSLSDKLKSLSSKGQWISVSYALSIALQIGSALVVAHNAHIVHRDLKPSNILLRDDGTPVLADLGIAAMQQATVHLTQTGGVLGTPDYMSPEQASSQMIDGRSDIYSLGVILHELLSGQLPFEATSPWAMVHQHVYEQPMPLQQVRADLTPQTYQVVAKCLQKKPEDRYADAAALVAALDAALAAEKVNPLLAVSAAGETIVEMSGAGMPLKTETLSPVAVGGGQKRPLLKIAFFALMGVVLVAFAFLLWRNMASPDGDDVATPGLGVTEEVADVTETAVLPTATSIPTAIPTATILPTIAAVVPSATVEDDISDSSLGLIAYSCSSDGFGEIYLYDLASKSERRLPDQPHNSIVPSFAHSGQQIVYRSDVNGAWQIFVSNLDGSNQYTITGQENDNFEPVWSPDGGRMAFVSDRSGEKQIYVMNSDGTNQQRLTFSNAYEDDPTWSVNDELAFESNRDGRYNIYRLSLSDGQPQLLVSMGDSSTTPAWSQDGSQIAFESRSGSRRNIWVADRDGSNLQLITSQGSQNQRPAWSPDGRFLAFHTNFEQASESQFDIWIIEIESGELQRITRRGDCIDAAWGLGDAVGETAVSQEPQILYSVAEAYHLGDEAELEDWPPLYGRCFSAQFEISQPVQNLRLEMETWGVKAQNPIRLNGQEVAFVPVQGSDDQQAWTPPRILQLPGNGLQQGSNLLEICAGLLVEDPDFPGDLDDFRFRNLNLKTLGIPKENLKSLTPSFATVPLGENANAFSEFQSPPSGNVDFENIPFLLSNRIFKSQASTAPSNTFPEELELSVNVPRATRIHFLINSGNAFLKYDGLELGVVEVTCDERQVKVGNLQLGWNIREWHNGQNVVIAAENTSLVWSESITTDTIGYIDLLTLDLPHICRNGLLTSIRLADNSILNAGSLDPALNLTGLTVELE